MISRTYPSCGMIQSEDSGPEVVLLGLGTSEIFNLEDREWRTGPTVESFDTAGAAQYGDTFIVAGGKSNSFIRDSIFEFDLDGYQLVERPQKLSRARNEPGLVMVPSDFVQC